MLEIELDIFSGMPNPRWLLSNRQEKMLFDRLNAEPTQLSPAKADRQLGLGYRGLIVRQIKSDDGAWAKASSARDVPFPNEFRLGRKAANRDSAANWLLKSANRQGASIPDEVQEVASRGVVIVPALRGPRLPRPGDFKRVKEAEIPADVPYKLDSKEHETWWACGSSCLIENSALFNHWYHMDKNNCYCFASNHLADIRGASPGRRGGRRNKSLTCSAVIAGLRADGWKDGCQPTGLTIALVMWPNQDFHFYRLVTASPFWSWDHKPGGTAVRWWDECGNPIYQYQGKGYAPNNICRGGYKDLCGYFYQSNLSALVA